MSGSLLHGDGETGADAVAPPPFKAVVNLDDVTSSQLASNPDDGGDNGGDSGGDESVESSDSDSSSRSSQDDSDDGSDSGEGRGGRHRARRRETRHGYDRDDGRHRSEGKRVEGHDDDRHRSHHERHSERGGVGGDDGENDDGNDYAGDSEHGAHKVTGATKGRALHRDSVATAATGSSSSKLGTDSDSGELVSKREVRSQFLQPFAPRAFGRRVAAVGCRSG